MLKSLLLLFTSHMVTREDTEQLLFICSKWFLGHKSAYLTPEEYKSIGERMGLEERQVQFLH